jgi:PAS domain S-box-containing protein
VGADMKAAGLYDNSEHPVCILDLNYEINYCNSSFCECFNFTNHEICGNNFFNLIDGGKQKEVRNILNNKLVELKQIEEEISIIDNAGRTENFNTTFINFNDDADRRKVLVVCRKETGKKLLFVDMENTFKQFFENTLTGIAVINLGGEIIFINDYNCFFLETTREKLEGAHYRAIIHGEDYPLISSFFSEILSGSVSERTLVHRINYRNGNTFWFRSGIRLVKDRNGSPVYSVMMSQNITKEVELEDELLGVKLELLTSKEREVLRHLSLGLSRREVAREMDIADATYDKHLRNMKIKLKKKNTRELVEFSYMTRRTTKEKEN